MRLLLIIDGPAEAELAMSISFYRPTYTVLGCEPEGALERLAAARADLVVVAPGLRPDRFQIMQRIRGASAAPLVVRTATADERETLRSLDSGADLVLPPPLTARTLVGHIDALLRRMGGLVGRGDDTLRVGGLEIDLSRHTVTVDGRAASLTPIEFALLRELAANAGRVLPRETLLSRIWGRDYHDEAHYLCVYIARLRAKIERDPRHPRLVITVRGVGYELPREDRVARTLTCM